MTTKSPTKTELFDALQAFTRSVRVANGIRVIGAGTGKIRANSDLVGAYMRACALTGEKPIPAVYESTKLTKAERIAQDQKLDARTERLMKKWSTLVEQKKKRGFGLRAIVGCVIDAENAAQRAAKERRNARRRKGGK